MKSYFKLLNANSYINSKSFQEGYYGYLEEMPDDFSMHLSNIIACLDKNFLIQNKALHLISRYLDFLSIHVDVGTSPNTSWGYCNLNALLASAGYSVENRKILYSIIEKVSPSRGTLIKQVWNSIRVGVHDEYWENQYEVFTSLDPPDTVMGWSHTKETSYEKIFIESIKEVSDGFDEFCHLSDLIGETSSPRYFIKIARDVLSYMEEYFPNNLSLDEIMFLKDFISKMDEKLISYTDMSPSTHFSCAYKDLKKKIVERLHHSSTSHLEEQCVLSKN